MNKKVLYCVYDKVYSLYVVSTYEDLMFIDGDIACELGCKSEQDYDNYFSLLKIYGAKEIEGFSEYEKCHGFEYIEDCQRCVDAINQAENIQELFKDVPDTINNKDNITLIKQDILSMPAGKELDRLIYLNIIDNAEKYIKENNRDDYAYPEYSKDMSLAYTVLSKMKKELYFSKRKKLMEIIQEVTSKLSGSEYRIDFSDLLWFITPEAIFKAILIFKMGLED